MAMTKAEQARVEKLEQSVRTARAMRWPTYAFPAPMTKEEIQANLEDGGLKYGSSSPQKVAFGWFGGSHDRGGVTKGCSDGVNHGPGNTTSIQGMGRMFRTEADAWKAVRIEMTERFAAILADVDDKIAAASSET